MSRWTVLVLVALASGAVAQDRPAVLSGVVTDAETGETLIGATVVAGGRGGATNAYGFFSLELAPGSVRVVVGYVGYAAQTVDVDLTADRRLDVALAREAALGEVVVEADDGAAPPRPEATAQMGRLAMQGEDVRRVPALLGEADVLKAVQLLPGVRAGQEGTAGLYVRGGSPDQTLILLDGAPIYNAAHLFGFLSTFNGDAVQRVELTKGAYPARFGGRLGSVLDVRLRDGDDRRHRVQARVGVLAAQVTAEGPVVPGRASFLVSARRTYLDVLARPFIDRANRRAEAAGEARVDPRVSFFDLHAKLNGRLSERDRVYLSLYAGGDAFAFESVDPVETCADGACRLSGAEDVYGGALDWGNVLGSLRYTRVLSPRAFAALTLTASDYAFDVGVDVEEGRGGPEAHAARARYRSGIRDLGARLDVDVLAGRGHALRVGGSVTRHRFTPGALALVGGAAGDADSLLTENRSVGIDAAVYAEDTWSAGFVEVGAGLRAAVYASGRYVYPSVEPRVSALVRLGERVALKASAAVTQQPVHLLTTGAGVGLPADLWVPADSIGPERGGQVAVGVAGSSASGRTTWSAEGYWRRMRGLVAYRDGASFATPAADWQDLVVTGAGRSRGVEAFVRHRTDRVTVWGSYTLAWADRQFDALDGGRRFPFRYDRRHDLSAVALVRLSRRFDVSAALAWGSGDAVTLPGALHDGTYLGDGNVESWVRTSEAAIEETTFGPRNGHRLPAVARLDLGATLFLRRGPRPHAVALHVYNATNRKAPFVTRFESRPDPATGGTRRQLVGIALFPVLPTLSYQVSL